MSISYPKNSITGVILAGGQAKRMGGLDKGLIDLARKAMIEHMIMGLRPQVGGLIISANRNSKSYARFGYPVIPDAIGDYFGPLAGMATSMRYTKTPYIAVVPCDSPLVSSDLVERLYVAMNKGQADISVAHDGERMQPVFALLQSSLWGSIIAFLEAGDRKIDLWYAEHKTVLADFSDRPEVFSNVNTPEDRAALEKKFNDNV
uniref:Molybdenum cofactor guanylyltransferase n=1 Tax=Candidatus Kentrum sp. TUN TaxID=2126343 RepID=A0A450ZJR7_9GAMM|nr:MAG: molybdenum cofactor guanylyltransferase [Candidatus Kentron sp. TUN]VFK53254.1 MAG: molybdenum cofactor guanylyltransferase [Candidatus Kentron sp. TUN]VFK54055.1 MAG: molybdenum cofactor guanylyltransferase [Candidatus Kentron sp. TUN]